MKTRKQSNFIFHAFACLPLLLITILCFFAFCLPTQYGNTYLGEMKYKLSRLEETDGKRIVIIGGSSVAFGQDSALMESYLEGYSVVNFGLYGDLGTKLMLDLAEDSIKEGDIVIVAPELDKQTLSLFFSGNTFWQAADGNFGMLSHVKRDDIGNLIGTFPQFAGKKASYFLNGSPNPTDIYRCGSFNEYGDIKSGLRDYNTMNNGFDANHLVSFDPSIVSEDFIDYLNQFATKVQHHGASIYYRMCPVNDRAVNSDHSIDEFYDYLDEKLNFTILGDPNNSIIDWKYFYDSNFHLNDSGVILNTRNLIRDIKIILADTSPTDIVVPNAPIPPISDFVGDNSDATMFTYTLEDDHYIIDGLNAEGKLCTKLILPTHYHDLPVIGFSKSAFDGAVNLTQLTIQENISTIYDHSFDECINLTKLILLHTAPNHCIVGNDLFGKAKFNVYVPSDLLHSYRVNYFWAQYGDKIFAF